MNSSDFNECKIVKKEKDLSLQWRVQNIDFFFLYGVIIFSRRLPVLCGRCNPLSAVLSDHDLDLPQHRPGEGPSDLFPRCGSHQEIPLLPLLKRKIVM